MKKVYKKIQILTFYNDKHSLEVCPPPKIWDKRNGKSQISQKTEENDFYLTGYLSKLHEKGRQMYNDGYIKMK